MTKETKTTMTLNSLSSIGTSKNRKRVGRGIGSGTGKTPEEVIKVKNQDQAAILDKGLRVDKCHFR